MSPLSTAPPRDVEPQRHKPASPLHRPRELVVACVPMRSNVNLSLIARTASACAIHRMIVCGNARLIKKISREGTETFSVETRRSIVPVLRRMAEHGHRLVGLEQTTHSTCLHDFVFARKTVLVVGNERLGIAPDVLALLHDVVEIPVWGLPHSYNVASAATMALYEYCRQFPRG